MQDLLPEAYGTIYPPQLGFEPKAVGGVPEPHLDQQQVYFPDQDYSI